MVEKTMKTVYESRKIKMKKVGKRYVLKNDLENEET